MKNPKEEAMRILLQNLGQSEEEIEKSLAKLRQDEENLQREQEQKEKELEGKLKTSEAAAEYLQEKLGGKWSHQKVRQLKREGLLKPYNNDDGNKVKKTGYRFHVDTLDEYVKLVKTPVAELLKENQSLKERLEMVEKELALYKAQPLSGAEGSVLPNDSTIEGQIQWDENGEFEEVKNETDENLEKPENPEVPSVVEEFDNEELITEGKKAVFIQKDDLKNYLRRKDAPALLDEIIAKHPEYEGLKETFMDQVFKEYVSIQVCRKSDGKYKAPHKKRGQYEYDTKEEGILATLEALKKQG